MKGLSKWLCSPGPFIDDPVEDTDINDEVFLEFTYLISCELFYMLNNLNSAENFPRSVVIAPKIFCIPTNKVFLAHSQSVLISTAI